MTEKRTYRVYLSCYNCDHVWHEDIPCGLQWFAGKCPRCECYAAVCRPPTDTEKTYHALEEKEGMK